MFFHHFRYAFKTLLRNKMLIFWTFAFPILLGTFFQMAFSDIEKNEQLDIIPIAIVNNESFLNNDTFQDIFQQLSDQQSDNQLFDTQYVSEDEAKRLLNDQTIDGYVIFNDDLHVVINQNGIHQTILKYVTEEISQREKLIKDIAQYRINQEIEENPMVLQQGEAFYTRIYQEVAEMSEQVSVHIDDQSSQHMSYTMIEFYTLIAMTCMYGGTLGMASMNHILANMSDNGKRVSVSPVHKRTMILGSMLSSYIVQLIGLLLLFVYTIFVLKVDYGEHILLIVLLACMGSFAGLSLGVAVGTLVKSGEGAKTGIIISITMLCSFLSGMMGITMKYVIDKNVPIVNMINPASMITDGLYALYYYETFDRYYFDVISLLVFSMIMICISYLSLRRQAYDSI